MIKNKSLSGCKDGDVKIGNDDIAMMYKDGALHPICMYGFVDGTNGGNLFCKKLGYDTGSVSSVSVTTTDNAIQVGACQSSDDDIASCTGGVCNTLEVGGTCGTITSPCGPGNVAMKITCSSASSTFVGKCQDTDILLKYVLLTLDGQRGRKVNC